MSALDPDSDDIPLLRTVNEFNLANSFWFTVGTLMQQGSDLNPKVNVPPRESNVPQEKQHSFFFHQQTCMQLRTSLRTSRNSNQEYSRLTFVTLIKKNCNLNHGYRILNAL